MQTRDGYVLLPVDPCLSKPCARASRGAGYRMVIDPAQLYRISLPIRTCPLRPPRIPPAPPPSLRGGGLVTTPVPPPRTSSPSSPSLSLAIKKKAKLTASPPISPLKSGKLLSNFSRSSSSPRPAAPVTRTLLPCCPKESAPVMSGKADMSPRPSPLLLLLLLLAGAEVGLEGAEGEMGDDSAWSG